MSRARSLAVSVAVAGVLVSCASISGLSDKEAVDCPGGCADGGDLPPRPDGSSSGSGDAGGDADIGPPACDPTKDAECMPLPTGWTLVARASVAGGEVPPCPTNMTNASTPDESPVAPGNTCTCDACTVTAAATCSGALGYAWGEGAGNDCDVTGFPTHYKNAIAGTCYTDLFTGAWDGERNQYDLPQPGGGACNATPTKHLDRVTFNGRSLLCDDTGRCSGGVCDGRIDAPFETCVARAGDEQCPSGFPSKHVVGTEGAEVDCGGCSCNVIRAACQGIVQVFNDALCNTLLRTIPANGDCGGPDTENITPAAYKVLATSATTCSLTAGTTTATNARMKSARTICCRQ